MPKLPELKPQVFGIDRQMLIDAIPRLVDLLERLKPVPATWADEKDLSRISKETLDSLACESYADLIEAWEQAMVWTPGLDAAFVVMLASCTSVMLVGDQLWVKIIGPASCGKSTLCEAISVNTKYVIAKSTIRGFHSGFGEGEYNLIDEAAGKTLITKDGDTIMQSPNVSQILSEGRDVYDTVSRSSYRNKASKDHVGKRLTWIIAGTSSIRQMDHSELGERFLDCVIMESIDVQLEEMICINAAKEAASSCKMEVTKEADTRYSPQMTNAMRLTAGYVNYLRENTTDITSRIHYTEEDLKKIAFKAIFVSHMRARPSKTQDESNERELAARLTKQLTRMAVCQAAVLNKSRIDEEVMKRTLKVALDTARGQSLKIAQVLYRSKIGMEVTGIVNQTGELEAKVRELLRFLSKINVVESFSLDNRGSKKYRLTARFKHIFQVVHG